MRLFLIGLLLLNVAYFFVPERGVNAFDEAVPRGDRRLPLLVKLDEELYEVKAEDGVSRRLDGRSPKDVANPVAPALETASGDVVTADVGEGEPGTSPANIESKPTIAGTRCFTVGPYRREAKAELMTAKLQKSGFKVDWRASKERRTRGYSVFLPSYPSYEAAEAVVKKLAEQGVNDYYILTDAERRNSVSLGFFTLKAGSEKRMARLQAMGYNPQVEVRFDEIPVFWLDYQAPTEAASEAFWQENDAADNVELLLRECK